MSSYVTLAEKWDHILDLINASASRSHYVMPHDVF